jgi:HlyD family secretion protein
VDAYGDERFTGIVRDIRLQPEVVQNVVSYTTVIDVANPSGRLKPGMTATVRIEVERADDVLKVPAAALRFSPTPGVLEAFGGGKRTQRSDRGAPAETARPAAAPNADSGARAGRVWVLRNERLVPVRVTPGLSDGTMVAVESADLQPGVDVVTGVVPTDVARQSPASGSPLMPSFPRRGGNTPRGNR